jgi:hypothetical protein
MKVGENKIYLGWGTQRATTSPILGITWKVLAKRSCFNFCNVYLFFCQTYIYSLATTTGFKHDFLTNRTARRIHLE